MKDQELEKLKKNYQKLLLAGSFIILSGLFIFALSGKKSN